ncbi:hypothetical protein AYO20_07361 [Fonsecaea nubica]|uniref:Uncharacterized protein n=1 Tax=Fonsecaea nubica TaxID=856822 RepID=A0A178CU12_9EURO|nr:hypothetical protein AYO20_07361 [Fonsecaea nubica]OAL33350.1 hypothetical protein AYO20_07361 [Fonsecaea nubica]
MDHQDNRGSLGPKKRFPPAIMVLQGSPDHYFRSVPPHSSGPPTSSTVIIDEASSPASNPTSFPKLTPEPPPLIVARAMPAHLHWLDLNVRENRTQVDPSRDSFEKFTQGFENLRRLFGSGTSITEVIVYTYQSTESISPQGGCLKMISV